MKIVVTFFPCDNGHLDAINPLTSKDKLIEKIEAECRDSGEDWLTDHDVSLEDFRQAEGEGLLELCEAIAGRGYFNVVDVLV